MTSTTIKINEVEYVRKDSLPPQPAPQLKGMEYCIIRCRDAGVLSGYVEAIGGSTGRMVKVHRARQLWRWDSQFVLIELATIGIKDPAKNKFSCESGIPVILLEACTIIPCTERGAREIIGHPATVNK